MTEEQRDATVGRVTREKKEADRDLAALRSEAVRLAAIFSRLGQVLKEHPEHVIFEGEPFSTALGPVVQSIFRITDIDGGYTKNLVADIRAAITRAKEKGEELNGLLP